MDVAVADVISRRSMRALRPLCSRAAPARLVAAAVVAAACGREPEPSLRVLHRLVDAVPARLGAVVGRDCAVDGERRPSLGCGAWGRRQVLAGGAAATSRVILFPAEQTNLPYVAQVRLPAAEPGATPEDFAPVSRPPAPAGILDLATAAPGLAAGAAFEVWTRPLPPAEVVTQPLDVPRGARLVVGLGLDAAVPVEQVAAVEFRVAARVGNAEVEILREDLAVDGGAARWHDRDLPLDAAAGAGTRLVFRTVVRPTPGSSPERALAAPLWGAPTIVVPASPADGPGLNVLLVSFDTLRADHVGAYGSALPTTPRMDRLAREGVLFENARTTFPMTTAAHMSMLTGLYPRGHGVLGPTQSLRADVPTLAALLAHAGWVTGAVTEDAMVCASCGFPRGFDAYRENHGEETFGTPSYVAGATFEAGRAWLATHARERFFLFLHTYVVHWPYSPPPEHDLFRTFRDGDRERPVAEAPPMVVLERLYAGETHYADALLADLLDDLDRLGVADRTVVVVTADHGEEFGEHGGWSHGTTLYDEVLRVPLIVRAPGRMRPGHRVTTPASLVDVLPTILDVVGVPIPPGLDGASQARRLAGAADEPGRLLYAQLLSHQGRAAPRVAAFDGATKWIVRVDDPQTDAERYDLATDRAEQHPLADAAGLARGRALAAAYLGGARAGAGATTAAPLDAATAQKLRALGYAE